MAKVINFDAQVQQYFNLTGQALATGDVVSLDPTNIDKGYVRIPVVKGEEWVLGIVAENSSNNTKVFVCRIGECRVRVDNSEGDIAIGDMLTCKGDSSTIAVKTESPEDYTIGYALQPYTSSTPGIINMEVNALANVAGGGGGGGGGIYGANNIGTGGQGLFKQVNGINLEFRNINAGSNRVSVTLDNPNNEIDINVNEGNISINNLNGTLGLGKGGTNNTSFTSGKFLAFDGTRIISTSYDENSFSNPGESPIQNAQNIGTGGVGIFKEVIGSALAFKNINAGNNTISVTNDTVNDEIDISVNPGNISIGSLSGTLAVNKGGTGTTSHTGNRFIMSNSSGNSLISSSFTASSFIQDGINIGTGSYVGLFKEKTGTNLSFKGITSFSQSISITDVTVNNVVNLDVNPAYINISDLNGLLSIAKGGTNNNSYTSGKFLVFDGVGIVSSIYDQNSFAGGGGGSGSSAETEAFAWFIS